MTKGYVPTVMDIKEIQEGKLFAYMKCIHLRIYGRCTELLFNTEKLIVLGNSFTSAGCTGLDLAGVKCNRKICDGGICGLA